jgi:hypothetical protein
MLPLSMREFFINQQTYNNEKRKQVQVAGPSLFEHLYQKKQSRYQAYDQAYCIYAADTLVFEEDFELSGHGVVWCGVV